MFSKIRAALQRRANQRAAALYGADLFQCLDPCGPTFFGYRYATFGRLGRGSVVVNWAGTLRRCDGREVLYRRCQTAWRLVREARHYRLGIHLVPGGLRVSLTDTRPGLADLLRSLVTQAAKGQLEP